MQERLVQAAVPLDHARIDAFAYAQRLERLADDIKKKGDPIDRELATEVDLELQLDRHLLEATPPRFPSAGDASEFVLPAADAYGPDAVGAYVPRAPRADARYALVVVLHGRGESESDITAFTRFRELADAQHAVLVAPWANNASDWDDGAPSEVSALIAFAQAHLSIDPSRIYIAGISMGGAGAFHIASQMPDRFAGVLSIIGDLNRRDETAVRRLRDRNVYLVNGGSDPIMTERVMQMTSRLLDNACVTYSRYIAPSAGHSIRDLSGELTQAWNDMFAGVQRNTSRFSCHDSLSSEGGGSDQAVARHERGELALR